MVVAVLDHVEQRDHVRVVQGRGEGDDTLAARTDPHREPEPAGDQLIRHAAGWY
nr:hypothetical protein [Allokutzneria sp. NRRL B-24872]